MDTETMRKCHCGGTAERHKELCPLFPQFGYDPNGVPYTESQLPKLASELGRKMAERRNKIVMDALKVARND